MAKPICIIYFPEDFSFTKSGKIIQPLELMGDLNGWGQNGISEPHEGFDGYIWFVFFKEGITEPEFKVFYEKDFTEIQFEELKKLIIERLSTN